MGHGRGVNVPQGASPHAEKKDLEKIGRLAIKLVDKALKFGRPLYCHDVAKSHKLRPTQVASKAMAAINDEEVSLRLFATACKCLAGIVLCIHVPLA